MVTSTFDSREAYHRLREGGMDEPAANAVVEMLSPFVTRDILQTELANLQANIQATVHADLAHFQLRIITFVAALNIGIATVAVAVAALVT